MYFHSWQPPYIQPTYMYMIFIHTYIYINNVYTWTPKEGKMLALWAPVGGFGPLSCVLLGSRYIIHIYIYYAYIYIHIYINMYIKNEYTYIYIYISIYVLLSLLLS